jgi:hypothetical protein
MSATEAPSILNEAIAIMLTLLTLSGFILLYILAIITSYYIQKAIDSILYAQYPELWSTLLSAMASRGIRDPLKLVLHHHVFIVGVLLTIITLFSACTSGLSFFGSLWHGLAVGTMVTAFLLVVELVVMALYACGTIVKTAASAGKREMRDGVKRKCSL